MPLAEQVLADLAVPLPDAQIQEFSEQAATALAVAHAAGYVHRDITPRNIMRIAPGGQPPLWVVADWGLVRRPRGQTTVVRTVAGGPFGTEGFAAPESWDNAHELDQRADIYSLGRVVAWASTGHLPAPNVDLPGGGIWRAFVRELTRMDAAQRPQDMAAVLELLSAPFRKSW